MSEKRSLTSEVKALWQVKSLPARTSLFEQLKDIVKMSRQWTDLRSALKSAAGDLLNYMKMEALIGERDAAMAAMTEAQARAERCTVKRTK